MTLHEATSSSPDALELLTLGYRRHLAGNLLDAIPYYQRAVQMDPNLGLAHAALSSAYGNVGDVKLSADGRPESLRVTRSHDRSGTFQRREHIPSPGHRGLLKRRAPCSRSGSRPFRTTSSRATTSPGASRAWESPTGHLANRGRLPGSFRRPSPTGCGLDEAIHADRMAEAETALDDARGRGFDSPLLRDLQAYRAFFRNDDAALQEVWTWAAGKRRGASRDQWERRWSRRLGASFVPPSARRRPRLR